MALIDKLTAIGNAIRSKTGKSDNLTLTQMANEITGLKVEEDFSWHQCPSAVRNYLSNSTSIYDNDTNYSTSVIMDYAPNGNPVTLSDTKPIGMTIDGTTFYNNVPNQEELYSTTNKIGKTTALDSLRWINTTFQNVAGINYPRGANTRDIGGWPCSLGSDNQPCSVKYGMIIRGSEPNVADKDLMVNQIGIKSELQLLPINSQTDDRKKKSVWDIDWYGNETTNSSVYGIESNVTNNNLWKIFLGAVFDSVAKSKPIYIHCGIGADRTGVVVVVLEAILGMTETAIAQDYELTNFAFYGNATNPRRRNTDGYKQLINNIKNVPLVNGLSEDTLENHAISYALSLGFTPEEINGYRNACLEGNPKQVIPQYTITKTLSNCTINSQLSTINHGESFNAEITPTSGYNINEVSILMNNVEISSSCYSNGIINISKVTGNLVINISASKDGPAYINRLDMSGNDWLPRKRIRSTGAIVDASTSTQEVSNCISISGGNIIRIKNLLGGSNDGYINYQQGVLMAIFADTSATQGTRFSPQRISYDNTNDIIQFTIPSGVSGLARFMFNFAYLPGNKEDVILTVNQEITE